MDVFRNKIYVITTFWSYPFGGGEEFLYDTMEWAHSFGMRSYWLAFADANNKPFDALEIIKYKFGTIIHIPRGVDVDNLTKWLHILKPDIVHHQGHLRSKFFLAANNVRTEFLTGFHFWTGGLLLDNEKKNIDILENQQYHQIDPELTQLLKRPRCHIYCVSKFVRECFEVITKVQIDDIIYASSIYNKYKVPNYDPINGIYVTMINIHKHKGGEILYYLLMNCPNIPFLCIKTENNSEELDHKIKEIIDSRNKCETTNKCVYLERTSNMMEIYAQTKILLCPSIVDETFCRVVNEGMMNGIPILTTHKGNIKYLLDAEITPILDINRPDFWKTELEKLYFDDDIYRNMSGKMFSKYLDSSDTIAKKQFHDTIEKVLSKSKEQNIGIFTPWCDQGLGIQSRNYAELLKLHNNVFIFAIKPYNANNCIELQKSPDEWITDNIYYSKNCREDVNDVEITEFVNKYNIGKMIIPETCWTRIFQIGKLLKDLNVKTYAIPNIETVMKTELVKHNIFYKILANNHLCENIFTKHSNLPVEYIGYGISSLKYQPKTFTDNVIKYLFIGGMNAFSRKNILLVCNGFVQAYEKNKDIHLTCTIQKFNELEKEASSQIIRYLNHPGITIIDEHLSHMEIIELYYSHHINLHLSKHEGLGIGLYEGIYTGTPVLTLNTPPHNEIITDNVNGWVIDCYYEKMTDNKDSLFQSAVFDPKVLSDKILEISTPDTVTKIGQTLQMDLINRLNYERFISRFVNSLDISLCSN